MKEYISVFVFVTFFSLFSFAQVEETPPPNYIKTIEFMGNTDQAQLPILKLGEPFQLRFDDIIGDERDYYYTIEHYNFDWTPSSLSKGEYIDGFDDVRIENYENSFNTLQIYSHYRLNVPNRDVRRLTKSGNYLIKVFDDRRNLIFSRKFMIYEDQAGVSVGIRRSRDLNFIHTKQVVNFTITSQNQVLINPKQNVKTLVLQNYNLKTAITDLEPQYTLGNELVYRYDQESAFWGGNEYFNFDNSDVRGATVNIRRVELEDTFINYLYTNITRKDRPYTYNPDINGNFVVRNVRGEKASIDAEYVWIHFALQYYDELQDGQEIHLYGNFSNYTLDESTRMDYDSASDTFRNRRLFKQGFYNYKYVIKNRDGSINEGAVSGDFDETENEYTVIVYYRDLGGRFDRIIGVGSNNSVNITNN
tara:strand:- start:12851 stop:14107 length:1257 start_codon:yes stop_codon:yes gene_type:complete